MTPLDNLSIGMNGRFFPANWRPALDEISFAQAYGFEAIQFRGMTEGLNDSHLGADLETIGATLAMVGIVAVMEIVVPVDAQGKTPTGKEPLDILYANLRAIDELQCGYVHWHFVPTRDVKQDDIPTLEDRLWSQLKQAVILADQYAFDFGLEHNEPDLLLFGTPQACAGALEAVPDLYFVWDFNHTIPDHRAGFQALIPRMSMLHVADTLLPEVNYHLPLGEGNVDFTAYCAALREGGFSGPAILEIGGLPKSGGYGRDTDEALIASLQRLREANGV